MQKRWCTTKPVPQSGRWHQCSAAHADLVASYRAARLAQEQERDRATREYRTEVLFYPPLITFRAWLVQSAQECWNGYGYDDADDPDAA